MHQLTQLLARALRVVQRLADQRLRGRIALALRPARELERDDRMDQALLSPVVEIPDHAPALLVGRGDDAPARLGLASAQRRLGAHLLGQRRHRARDHRRHDEGEQADQVA